MKKYEGLLVIAIVLLILSQSACSPAARTNIAAAAAGAAQGATGSDTAAKLMIFGGLNHRTYLGCLNCSQYATDSVFNEYGSYGSRYASESIWNHYNDYGSAYSSGGVCNAYATDPPVIVDSTGKYYGRLTLNSYHAELGAGATYYNWLKQSVCESN